MKGCPTQLLFQEQVKIEVRWGLTHQHLLVTILWTSWGLDMRAYLLAGQALLWARLTSYEPFYT